MALHCSSNDRRRGPRRSLRFAAVAQLSKDTVRQNARQFSLDWADASSEKSDSQTFWIRWFEVFGLRREHVAVFEESAKRTSTGRRGWVDVFVPGQMAVEHKSLDLSLDAAMGQLIDYLPSLPTTSAPWLLVVSDFRSFQWHNLRTGQTGTFPLADFSSKVHLFWWLAEWESPIESYDTEEDVNLAASQRLADVHDALVDAGYDPHAAREWITRILFCLFADDTEVWDPNAFHILVGKSTRLDGSDLGRTLQEMFEVLNTAPEKLSSNLAEELRAFRHINGDLFGRNLPTASCSTAIRDAILECCAFDWSKISPAIFGSMFQNVMTPRERRHLGAHYTSERDILRVIEPLFLDDLNAELAKAVTAPALSKLHDRISGLTLFDPACGCGNFLVVAYREVRRIETEILKRTRAVGRRAARNRALQLQTSLEFLCRVKVSQFYGLEIEEFPALIARTALYLMDHMANLEVSAEFSEHFVRFPIPASPHITVGNALTTDWNEILPAERASFVFGNPPFVGISLRDEEQTAELQDVWGDRYHGTLDYVTGWYAKAISYLTEPGQAFAFVSTNSIWQGEQVAPLWRPIGEAGFGISFAHRTFAWMSEARGRAHVHVIIVGLAKRESITTRRLFSYDSITDQTSTELRPPLINGYLTAGPDIIVDSATHPLATWLPKVRYGNKPADGGNFIVAPGALAAVRADPIASKYLRLFPGAHELLHNEERWCLWLADAPPEDIRGSQILATRVAAVRRFRQRSKAASTREAANTPTVFRQVAQAHGPFLCIPQHVSERRRYFTVQTYDESVIASNANFIADDPTGIAFAFLSSSIFIDWFRLVGGRIKSDLRFNKLLMYNTFPAPLLTDTVRAKVVAAGCGVLDARAAFPGSSLASLYDADAMPPALVAAHRELDRVIDPLFFGKRKVNEETARQGLLLEQYEHLVKHGTTPPLF